MTGRNWWPLDPEELVALQSELARDADHLELWRPKSPRLRVAACFVAGRREPGGNQDDPAWAGAVLLQGSRLVASAVLKGVFAAPYRSGLLALREGKLLEQVIRSLKLLPDVLLVNATGRDHPRRAGLALHLGAALGVPSVGVTDRTLVASGPQPGPGPGARAPIYLEGELVGFRLRARRGVRPLVVHAGWQLGPEGALAVVEPLVGTARTPQPMRLARRLARTARAADTQPGRVGPA